MAIRPWPDHAHFRLRHLERKVPADESRAACPPIGTGYLALRPFGRIGSAKSRGGLT